MLNYYSLVTLILLSSFVLGGYVLEDLGVQYVSEGGPVLLKIHLYSYLIFLGTAIVFFRIGISSAIISLGEFAKNWCISFLLLGFVIVYGVVQYGTSGMAYLVDTFLTPLFFLLLLSRLSKLQCEKLLTFLAYLLLFNSFVALMEFFTQSRFVNVEFKSFSNFRSTAFLTHPLNNALITVGIAFFLFDKTVLSKFVYISIITLALFAFGGRAATGIFFIGLFIYYIPIISFVINYGTSITKNKFAFLSAISFVILITMFFVFLESGIAERIISKLYVDESASARFDVFYLLEQLTPAEWFFGASKNLQDSVELYLGISVIENYLIAWLFSFGLIGGLPLLAFLLLILYTLARSSGYLAWLSVMLFLIVSISNNSMTTKTPALLLLMTSLYLYYRINKIEVRGC
ncbi:VpsF family polysaccharide biosynthesis protein [Shewanella frigidimarina]|uniref:VpsF family polysaccharide biosynthesis protein n=1 Tax=Shewanella frigidimarina TaxID=56812 RepID=UPI003D79E328